MSPPPTDRAYPDYPDYPPPVHPHNAHDDDAKAPYDDLIDQYATPFQQNARHKVHKVEPLAFDQKTDGSGKDLEGASSNGHDWAYPPTASSEEKGKGKAWTWRMVRDGASCRSGRNV